MNNLALENNIYVLVFLSYRGYNNPVFKEQYFLFKKKTKKKLDKFFFNYLYVCVCVYVSFPKRELFERAGDDDVKHDKLYIYVLIVIMVIMV